MTDISQAKTLTNAFKCILIFFIFFFCTQRNLLLKQDAVKFEIANCMRWKLMFTIMENHFQIYSILNKNTECRDTL